MDAKHPRQTAFCYKQSFNPRARDGREHRYDTGVQDRQCFNPRARDGREVITYILEQTFQCFNPRARDGREANEITGLDEVQVSIHAPVMDANACKSVMWLAFLFQSTRP